MDEYLLPVLEQLCYYFARDPKAVTTYGLDLDKGLCLYGPIGCGKTRLLELLLSLSPLLRAKFADCDDVARLYKVNGDEALDQFCRPGRLLLDDLGVDDTAARHYGNGANPLADVLRRRYRLGERALTFATTNCNAAALEQLYRERIADRMCEMFNFVAFDEATPSRRQHQPVPLQ